MELALRKLQWAKDTPRWVTTNTASKKGLKGRLVVVVTVVGFALLTLDLQIYIIGSVRGLYRRLCP